MDALINLFESVSNVFWSLLDVVQALFFLVLPWLPIIAWAAYWLFAVNWAKAFDAMRRGGAFGVLFLMFMSVLVWGSVAPPEGGYHSLFGLEVSNYAGKFMYVTVLTCIALLCGSLQMSGFLGSNARFAEAESAPGPASH